MVHLLRIITLFSIVLLIAACGTGSQPASDEDPHAAYLQLSLEERQQAVHATEAFDVADGLSVQLFAGEPMVVNPTNIAIDERGRIWVCESYNYAVPEAEQTEKGGRIIILSDTDQDGVADERKVFYQGDDVHLALGINKLGNKVYVTRSPNLLVFTDLDGDDVPDQKDTLLSGMGKPGDHSAHALVFGPDGRLYFNYGNNGQQMLDADGKIITDLRSGNAIRSDGKPYHGGMIFRMDQDGKNVEVLAHNFRNNYEVCIDSYGNLWQSDNDDDGNKSVRINYIQEYGNYGYLDEYTGAHWSAPRTGMHDSIPKRHWHQNDPGVVPNMLITGAGSPAGITVYEGDLLPEVFRGQIIHADAGPNVVRAYRATPDGAGFTASRENILTSPYDQWFRPVDVAVAPDGSLFVADWYDPIVGGAAAGDREKGRIFRIAPPDTDYAVAATDLTTLDGAIAGLQSPNESVRYLAWQTLHEAGNTAEPHLKNLWENGDDRMRARALWLLGQLPEKGEGYVAAALQHASEQIRITGLRLARQMGLDVPDVGLALVEDKSARVRAESAIALRDSDHPDAAGMWAILAQQHDGRDRWYLEALGIGADPRWPKFFEYWLQLVGEDWNTPGGRDIVWRSRSPAAAMLLADLIVDPQTTASERLRYFRAFDFHRGNYKNEALLSLLEKDHAEQGVINALVLQHLDTEDLVLSPKLKEALEVTLTDVKGTWQYVELVEKFDLRNKKQELLDLAATATKEEAAAAAARLLTDPETFNGTSLIKDRIQNKEEDGLRLIKAIQATGRPATFELLQEITWEERLSPALQKAAIQAMAQTWTGEDYLLKSVMDERFPDALKPLAASVLFSVYRTSIHEETAKYLERPANAEQKELPPIRVLVATVGNAEKGKAIFEVQCMICHRVREEGVNFGPDLSQIGSKLDKEGLYRSILYPNEGVSYGYETYKLTLQSGTEVVGLLASETEDAVDLKLAGGQVQTYAKSDIAAKEQMTNSMMPNLALVLEEEQLVDLVAYLSNLK